MRYARSRLRHRRFSTGLPPGSLIVDSRGPLPRAAVGAAFNSRGMGAKLSSRMYAHLLRGSYEC